MTTVSGYCVWNATFNCLVPGSSDTVDVCILTFTLWLCKISLLVLVTQVLGGGHMPNSLPNKQPSQQETVFFLPSLLCAL